MLLFKLFNHKFDYTVTEYFDIALVLLLIYFLYRRIKGTLGINIFIGMLLIYGVYRLVKFFHLDILSDVLGLFVNAGVIAMLVVFQPEIRKFLLTIGSVSLFDRFRFLKKFTAGKRNRTRQQQEIVNEIVTAVENMSLSNTGALLVFTDHFRLQDLNTPGVPLQALISGKLIESIFNKTSPLHDGAMIIANQKIIFAGSVLPVSESPSLPSRIGLRHRSAVGITEHGDAVSIVVSEETGNISYAKGGELHSGITVTELRKLLQGIITGEA